MTAIMERSLSSDPLAHGRQYHNYDNGNPTPPWEQYSATQVPFMAPNSSHLTHAEKQALTSLWAAREQRSSDRAQLGPKEHSRRRDGHGRSLSPRNQSSGSIESTTTPPPMPFEPFGIPQGPKSAPTVPSFVKQVPSPSQRQSLSDSSTKSSVKSGHYEAVREVPPPQKRPIAALPGTMSTREKSPSRSRSRGHTNASGRSHGPKKDNPDKVPFGKRFKVAFKDIFKRDPIDETNLERIEDKHWTDE